MKVKTIIKENELTPNNHIYDSGSLQRFKERIQEAIDNRKCFVMLHKVFEDIYNTVYNNDNKADYCWIYNDMYIAEGNFCGIVNSFDITEGQGVLDIDLLDDTIKNMVEVIGEDNFRIDFPLIGKLKQDKENKNYFDIDSDWTLPPFVLLVKTEEV